MNTPDMEKWTRQFIEMRDYIKRLEAEQKAVLKQAKDIQQVLSGKIQKFMSDNNLDKVATTAGTCYTTTRRTASLADPDLFMKYVIENRAFDLLDRRANSTAVQDFVKKNKSLPPGCNLSSISSVGVLRAGATAKDDE